MRAVVLLLAVALVAALARAAPQGEAVYEGYPQASSLKRPVMWLLGSTTAASARQTRGVATGRETSRVSCAPGAVWQEDCNYCRCGVDGVSRVCTMVICERTRSPVTRKRDRKRGPGDARPGRPERPRRVGKGRKKRPSGPCVPQAQVSFQCNSCTCNEAGTDYACTRQICPPPETPREKRDDHCDPGSTFSNDNGCNTCVCPENGERSRAACTLRACLQSLPQPPN